MTRYCGYVEARVREAHVDGRGLSEPNPDSASTAADGRRSPCRTSGRRSPCRRPRALGAESGAGDSAPTAAGCRSKEEAGEGLPSGTREESSSTRKEASSKRKEASSTRKEASFTRKEVPLRLRKFLYEEGRARGSQQGRGLDVGQDLGGGTRGRRLFISLMMKMHSFCTEAAHFRCASTACKTRHIFVGF